MKKSLLTILLGICLIPVFSQTVYNGTLATTDPTFNRPNEGIPPTSLSGVGTGVYYDLIPILISTTGLMDISTNSTWDNFLILYGTGGFSPASPLSNALVANDDLVSSSAGFTYNFTSTGIYYLVICSYKNGVTGTHSVTLTPTIILPIKLKSFTGIKSAGNTVSLNWLSESENNLNTYQVQRSVDGNVFADMVNGRVIAKNSATLTGYNHTDNAPVAGLNYYRLKITEKTGQISYSSVVLVKNSKLGTRSVKLYPNPSADYLQIETDAVQNSNGYVSIINAGGSVMQTGQYKFNSNAVTTIDIKQLPTGKYFLKTVINKVETSTLFIKN
jgi:Secretion system C-terminal sorting domain